MNAAELCQRNRKVQTTLPPHPSRPVNIHQYSHKFDNWDAFDILADTINQDLPRMRELELYVHEGQSHTWTEKLHRRVKVVMHEGKLTESVLGRSRIG